MLGLKLVSVYSQDLHIFNFGCEEICTIDSDLGSRTYECDFSFEVNEFEVVFEGFRTGRELKGREIWRGRTELGEDIGRGVGVRMEVLWAIGSPVWEVVERGIIAIMKPSDPGLPKPAHELP